MNEKRSLDPVFKKKQNETQEKIMREKRLDPVFREQEKLDDRLRKQNAKIQRQLDNGIERL